MKVLMTVWAVLTTALAVVLIYRNALSMHEDDQLFLDDAQSHLKEEQREVMTRMNQLRPIVNILSISSVALIVVMAGLWVWHNWSRF